MSFWKSACPSAYLLAFAFVGLLYDQLNRSVGLSISVCVPACLHVLHVCLFIAPFICTPGFLLGYFLSICLFLCMVILYICRTLGIFHFVCHYVRLQSSPYVCPSVRMFANFCAFLLVCRYVSMSLYLSASLPVGLSIC